MSSRAACLRLIGLIVLVLATPTRAAEPAPQTSTAMTLTTLLEAFRAAPGVEARFVEKRFIALLAAPLESEGTIHYSPPGLLARWVTRPRASFQIIDPKRVRMGDERAVETLDLGQKPQVRVFVESFVTLLAGDQAALERTYTSTFTPAVDTSPTTWRLRLVPRVAPLDKVIAMIELEGQGLVLRSMVMLETGGDETVTTFTAVDTRRVYTDAEKARLFRLDP